MSAFMNSFTSSVLIASSTLVACTSLPSLSDADSSDSYTWLEEVEGERALKFANEQNELSIKAITSDPRFSQIENELEKIILAKDRMPVGSLQGGFIYNFWQDDKNVRGIWRRTSLNSYATNSPKWETLLDLDILAKGERENWVWKGSSCLPPRYDRCLIHLSRGGKDASVVREFDLKTKRFIQNGFHLPEAKSSVSWIDRDHIFVATDFGENTTTDSGYPMIVKLWKRGAPLAQAKEVLRGEKSDVSAGGFATHRIDSTLKLLYRGLSFFESEIWLYQDDGTLIPIPMPRDASIVDSFDNHLIYKLRSDLKTSKRTLKTGSVVALPIEDLRNGKNVLESLSVVFEPSQTRFQTSVTTSKDAVLIETLDNVNSRIVKVVRKNDQWIETPVDFSSAGEARILSSDSYDKRFLVAFQSFTTPPSVFLVDESTQGEAVTKKIKSSPERFDSRDIVSEQFFATSRDGTKIPYFIVHKREMVLNESNPTILYGYGGFQLPMTAGYFASIGKTWLEKGGVYVLANIRGGGEFGPAWHQAALRENRQRAYDDFIAIAEDLIRRKITSSKHLGIEGGSNGGLLTSVAFTQRPDLFNAVVSSVPLADMLRYHKLLAGASWMDEYGSPEDPKMRKVLLKYSPFHNLKKTQKYPEVFFNTSTKDDRVHPAHARKMVAKMTEMGHPVLYYENIEGGHSGAANLKQRIYLNALEMTYFWQKLAPQQPK